MNHEFDRHVEVTPAGAGRYEATLDAGWVVGGGVNGGYLLGLLGNAVRQELSGKPDPVTVGVNYVTPSVPGPATVSVRLLKNGGTTATVAVDLHQEDQLRVTALMTYVDLSRLDGPVRTTAVEPELPPVEKCLPTSWAPEEIRRIAPLMERFDMRLDPACAGWAMGKPSGQGMLQAWFKLADGREPDPISLLMVADSLPPVTFDLGMPGWAPTLELNVHVRAIPAPGWLKVRHATRNLAGGLFEEDCEVWDSAGRLVVQARQLAMTPRS